VKVQSLYIYFKELILIIRYLQYLIIKDQLYYIILARLLEIKTYFNYLEYILQYINSKV